jgi:acylphosphatase
MKHFNITISGKVQGVFYRKYTVDHAVKLGLAGFVRNQPNGDVYCEVEGKEEVLKQFEEWCWKGSPFSKVTAVKLEEGALMGFQTFEIKRY